MSPRMLLALAVVAVLPMSSAQAHSKAKTKYKPGLYAPKAAETVAKENSFEYSNGAVNFEVQRDGKTLSHVGMSCNIGPTGTEGLPAYDEISIHLPKQLEISSSGSFSFSGSVTLSPEEAQAESSVTTTFAIAGRFTGKSTAEGTDSSPLCRKGTLTHFRVKYAEPLS